MDDFDKDTIVSTNECIRRQAALYLLEHEIELSNRALDFAELVGTEREKFSWGLGLLESIAEDIKQLPSAEPQTEGRWEIIHPGETGYSAGDFRCSVCGQPNRCYHLTKYCCNCGARMVNRGKVKKEKK